MQSVSRFFTKRVVSVRSFSCRCLQDAGPVCQSSRLGSSLQLRETATAQFPWRSVSPGAGIYFSLEALTLIYEFIRLQLRPKTLGCCLFVRRPLRSRLHEHQAQRWKWFFLVKFGLSAQQLLTFSKKNSKTKTS